MNAPVLLAIGATFLACFVSSLHFSLREFSLRKLELIAKPRNAMQRLQPIIDDPDAHALSMGALRSAIHVFIVICLVLAFATHEQGVGHLLPTPLEALWAGLIGAAVLYIFGLVIPHSISEHAAERLILSFGWFIRAVYALAAPLRALFFIDEAVKRLAGAHAVTEKMELEEELLDVVTEGEREGSLGELERDMIESVVELNSTTTEQIMTPRTDIEGVALTNDLKTIRNFIEQAGHSRIPVYEGDLDHIVGILYAKDLLRFVGEDISDFDLRAMVREAVFVPENKPVLELLVELRARKVHIAVVLDEYGGTTGIVTLEDILEEIVGEIEDEYEPEGETEPEINVDLDSRSAVIDARAYVRDANEALEPIGVTLPEHEDYDTVGGYVLSVLGHIPSAGESFRQNGHAVTILEAEPTRVSRLRVEAREGEPEAAVTPADSAAESTIAERASENDTADAQPAARTGED